MIARTEVQAPPAYQWPQLAKAAALLAAITVAVCGAMAVSWFALAPLSGAVVAQGTFKVSGDRKEVQHLTGGTVRQVLVREGDTVAIGDPLIVLADESVSASLDSIDVEREALMVKRQRLEAEARLADKIDFAAPATTRKRNLEALETSVFRARRSALDQQQSILRRQERELQTELLALRHLRATSENVRQIAEREEDLNRRLHAQGFISEMRLAQLEREHLQTRMQQATYDAEAGRSRQRLEDLRLRRATLAADYTRQANDELRETNAQLLRLDESRRPLKEADLRQTIRAPAAGAIVNLKVKSDGAVIAPGIPVMEIVPLHQPLIVESHVQPEQIAEIHAGQAATLRLTAYPNRTVPTVEGEVIYIGADRMEDPATRQPYYLVRIDIKAASVERARRESGETIQLTPGMGAEVFITTQARTPFEYLFLPILHGARRAMRER